MMLSFSVSVESSAVQTLRASAVSTSSAVTLWNAVPGATGYRLAWGPTAGTSKSVCAVLIGSPCSEFGHSPLSNFTL